MEVFETFFTFCVVLESDEKLSKIRRAGIVARKLDIERRRRRFLSLASILWCSRHENEQIKVIKLISSTIMWGLFEHQHGSQNFMMLTMKFKLKLRNLRKQTFPKTWSKAHNQLTTSLHSWTLLFNYKTWTNSFH